VGDGGSGEIREMTIDVWEKVVRAAGFAILVGAWLWSGLGAYLGARRRKGRSIGLVGKLRAHTVYAIAAIPYFAICIVLWRPLPLSPGVAPRVALLLIGSLVGLTGAGFYLLGRRELGSMYNVSSSLGSELYEDHQLVTTGPFSLCRHPMYFGLFLAAGGGLLIYRTWTMVFASVALAGAVFKARREDRLLAAEFGQAWERYAAAVPAWIPRPGKRYKEVSHVHAPARG
jgi:protein-S-isoprenylcysteine O-methyltransferase Ste14